ncbi:MAG: phosphotransferase [Candidatus Hodarchaeales archaeon]|jgi:aminoglycoside phosphotransferase (APT) family kinase protein
MKHHPELLANIPKTLLPEEITSALEIGGGLNNRNILINDTWLVKEFLIRDEANDPVNSRFLREKNALELFKYNIHSPTLLKYYSNSSNHFIAREWVIGEPITIDQSHNYLKSLVKALISVHSTITSIPGNYQYLDVIRRYLREYNRLIQHILDVSSEKNDFSNLPPHDIVNQYFNSHLHRLKDRQSEENIVRLHGDLVLSNIIVRTADKNITFIDWEYSTLGDPLIDLAYIFTQNQLPQETRYDFLEIYEKLGRIKINQDQLRLYCDLMNLMSGLWYTIQAARRESLLLQDARQDVSSADFINHALRIFRKLNLSME